MRSEFGLPDRYLLASARFISRKNLVRLMAAYGAAADVLADAPDLVLLGDGPERPAVEAAIGALRCPQKVHLTGFKAYDVLPVYYGLADGFVHVSTVDQWGLVINEAAASGIPVVVSRACGAATHLVADGESGLLVDPVNTDNIANALRRIMALSPDARMAMGMAGRRIVADWGVQRFADGFSSACNAALGGPSRRLAPWDEALLKILCRRSFAEPG